MANSEEPDLYAILGVLPGAEDIVIVAAYRALVQRYHPDRWKGNADEAHRRTSEINHAYTVLSDPRSRAEYDRMRGQRAQGDFGASETGEQRFAEALFETEERWKVASEVYPDLTRHRAYLARISARLAFGYVSTLLTTKAFDARKELASRMEQAFLEMYFSSDQTIVSYARKLILAGQRQAALELNKLVDVVGVTSNQQRLIELIDQRFKLAMLWKEQRTEEERNRKLQWLIERFRHSNDLSTGHTLASFLGYTVNVSGFGIFANGDVTVETKNGEVLKFDSHRSFVNWVSANLCDTPE